MNIVIVGQGAIGLLWYCKLAQYAVNKVSLYGSSRVGSLPPTVSMIDTEQRQHNVPLFAADDNRLQQAELVIFCVKAFDVSKAVNGIYQKISDAIPLILCHNGMINISDIDHLAQQHHPLLTLLTTHGAKKQGAFQIRHTGNGDCNIGYSCADLARRHANTQLTEAAVTTITQQLNQAFTKVTWCSDMRQKQWLKLLINCVINPLTAIEDIDNGLITSAQYDQQIDAIIAELIAIAAQQNILFNAAQLKHKILQVARLTAKNSSSMRCDLQAKRATEIEQINGYIVSIGKLHGVKTPVNQALYQGVKGLEKNT